MFGCHNCPGKPLPGAHYEESECANCKAKDDPFISSDMYEKDPAEFDCAVQAEVYTEPEEEYIAHDREIFSALGEALISLVDMCVKNPMTYQILVTKLQHQDISYQELAEKFQCKKQNVMYHLEKAFRLCPALKPAILIDNRFSRGASIKKRYSAGKV